MRNFLTSTFVAAALAVLAFTGFTIEKAEAACAPWAGTKISYNGSTGTNASNSVQDWQYLYTATLTSSTACTAPLGAGVAAAGVGNHVISGNSKLAASVIVSGSVGINPSLTIIGSRDTSATATTTTSQTYLAATSASNTTINVAEFVTPTNILQVNVAQAGVGSNAIATVKVYEKPNR